jgi:hypothetical protein
MNSVRFPLRLLLIAVEYFMKLFPDFAVQQPQQEMRDRLLKAGEM